MRKLFFLILFFSLCLSLFGQTFRAAKVFVPPVEGEGRAGDNDFFYRQLVYETVFQYHELVEAQYRSDFILKSSIELVTESLPPVQKYTAISSPVPQRPIPPVRNTPERREFFSWEADDNAFFYDTTSDEENNLTSLQTVAGYDGRQTGSSSDNLEFNFTVELINTYSGEIAARQFVIYNTVDTSVRELISVIVYNLFAGIEVQKEEYNWRAKWVFFDFTAFWAPRLYNVGGETIDWLNYSFKLALEVHFLSFMSIGAGAHLTQDWISFWGADQEYHDFILDIPLFLKFVLNPTDYFTIEPYGGISFNYSLTGVISPSPYSWFAGLQLGIKAGPGMLVIDSRFAMDFFNSHIVETNEEYQRNCIYFGFGYKIGFIPKRIR
ncbi:MAG: hypothetical protein LBI28_14215 [Treponema sp.]|jgi:hypothetical protein|nr:hypothetical protein [Treponema sp.]